jgi:ribosomal protein L6P/L9E
MVFARELQYEGVGFKAYMLQTDDFGDLEGVAKKLELKGVDPVVRLMNSPSFQKLFSSEDAVLRTSKILVSKIGFSNPSITFIPYNVRVQVLANRKSKSIIVFGSELKAVSQFAAEVRRLKIPERYKGKGILYAGEVISLKEGKRK